MSQEAKEVTVIINKKNYKFSESSQTGAQILEKAGFQVDQYDLFKVVEGKSEPVAANETIHLKNGDHFRVLPKDITLG